MIERLCPSCFRSGCLDAPNCKPIRQQKDHFRKPTKKIDMQINRYPKHIQDQIRRKLGNT